ncbi:hypothetical protein WOLCODRAFT_110043 [Wolfiporia cocos MD-104 SS10]|uniref:Protein-S-isoprenylcysteine O-methyltransferase n=1 Tax=Wolfiporia cocos (strain MD-104) TaxID=742152 RepID=A0A2H3J6I0_WOLCO|nr:hypothetical protein WOLCODRAFT_110043 [Wolfiporia cocos MD-104 SS10]
MDSVASLKITLLLAACASTHLAYTDPNLPVKVDEAQKFSGGDLLSRIYRWEIMLMKGLLWASTLSEVAVLISLQYPSDASEQILQLLARKGTSSLSRLNITPLFIAGSLMQIAGYLIRRVCFQTLGRHFTFALAVRDDHRLVTEGPYSVVRHPSYTGGVMVFVGMLLMQFGRGSWWAECGPSSTATGRALELLWTANVLGAAVMLILRTVKEDEVLRREFGTQWDKWAEHTRYRLVPGLY